MDDDRIIQRINGSHAVYELDASTIDALADAGFSDILLDCMINTGTNLVADQPPPLPLCEAPVTPPGQDFTWIPGEWRWQDGFWKWMAGGWILPPRPSAVWVPTRWEYEQAGWRCVPGRWH